jgi:predicted transcriptional regulator
VAARKYTFRTDEEVLVALQKLASRNSRSRVKQLEWLIIQAAMKEGVWIESGGLRSVVRQ